MADLPPRLLVVDDNEMNRDLLSRRLVKKQFEVATADDGQQALDQVAATHFDLVLLDIMMPGIDGLEVLRRLRATHSATDLPIIMVTAKDGSQDMVEALSAGANDYVTKPLDFPVVLARVQNQLALAAAARTADAGNDAAPAPPSLEDLVAAGESATVEFKSTLRWHTHAKRMDEVITYACLKTVNAFLNTDGGTLVIGVNDDGEAIGLDADAFKNDDKYLLHFYNVLKAAMGDATAAHVNATIVPLGDTTVCRVDCRASQTPVFISAKSQDEAFFIRTGPGSTRLSPSELLDFAISRFKLGATP